MANKKISQLPQVPLSALTTSDVMAVVNNGITKKVNLDDLSEYINTDNYTSGVTLNGSVLEFNRTDQTAAYSVDLSSIGGGGGSNYVYLGNVDFNLVNSNSGSSTFNFATFAYSGVISELLVKVNQAMDVDPVLINLEDNLHGDSIVFNLQDIVSNSGDVIVSYPNGYTQGASGFTITVNYVGMGVFSSNNTTGDFNIYVSFKTLP
jgi:hypothetical protein